MMQWSGRVVDNWEDIKREIVTKGNTSYEVRDLVRGPLPGSLRWPWSMRSKPPLGWTIVGYDNGWGDQFIARRPYAPPLWLWFKARAYRTWLREGGKMIAFWWSMRP